MNDTEIQVCGLSRSGNHAIIDWILRQCPGRTLFLNCAEGKTNPFLTCRPLADGRPWRASWQGFDAAAEAAGALSRKDVLVHSYEDSFLRHAFSADLDARREAWIGPSRRRHAVVILRDPFNLFASRRAMGADLPRATALRLWKQHARAALGRKGPLKQAPLVILYNRWAADRRYRQEIARHLGLAFSDAGIDRVAACNGGSSFDGLRYDGQAAGMPVSERWRAYADDPEYLSLFDDETVALSTRLFGPPPQLPRRPSAAASPSAGAQGPAEAPAPPSEPTAPVRPGAVRRTA